jgi:hypothetical protein
MVLGRNEDDYVGEFVNQMELIAKELAYASHPISDKIQVTTILNGLSLSWEHVITSLTLQWKKHFHNFLTSFTCVRRR